MQVWGLAVPWQSPVMASPHLSITSSSGPRCACVSLRSPLGQGLPLLLTIPGAMPAFNSPWGVGAVTTKRQAAPQPRAAAAPLGKDPAARSAPDLREFELCLFLCVFLFRP